jgi:GTPase SAR1 family protein
MIAQLLARFGTQVKSSFFLIHPNVPKAGCDHFQAVTKTFYRDAMGVLFVFDITNNESFKDLVNWYSEAERHLDLEYTSLAVAANKTDLENPAVSHFSRFII